MEWLIAPTVFLFYGLKFFYTYLKSKEQPEYMNTQELRTYTPEELRMVEFYHNAINRAREERTANQVAMRGPVMTGRISRRGRVNWKKEGF
jgi:hypothetical protein